MKLFIGHRLQGFTAEGSMGVVTDSLFINCYWPKLDRPTRIFAPGSNTIRVLGTTPRNVWFPDDVVFESYYPDALYPAEQAVFAAFPQVRGRRALINLGPSEAQVWWDAYNTFAEKLPPTAAVHQTTRTTNFLRHREIKSERTVTLDKETDVGGGTVLPVGTKIVKRDFEEFVAELTPQECLDLVDGKANEASLRSKKGFVCISDPDKTLKQWAAEKVK